MRKIYYRAGNSSRRTGDGSRKTEVWMKKICRMRMMKASVYLSNQLFLISTQNLFTIDKESSSDEDSASIEGVEAVESDDEPESKELVDVFLKLEYWAKKRVRHYRSRLLPDHIWAAYLCSPHTDVIKHAVDPNNLDSEDRMVSERLLKKLMVPARIVCEQERERVEAEVIDTYLTELESD
jgi:hypothetical protein